MVEYKFKSYWRYYKSENRFCASDTSKAKKYILEKSSSVKDDTSYSIFYVVINGATIYISKPYIFRCGYDRGPKKQSIINTLWNNF